MKKFLIFEAIMPFQNWDPVIYLKSKGMSQIVNYYHIFEFPVFYYSQVLDEETIFRLKTFRTIQNAIDEFALGIKEVDDGFCVVEIGSSEDVNLENLGHFLEKLAAERSDFEGELNKILKLFI